MNIGIAAIAGEQVATQGGGMDTLQRLADQVRSLVRGYAELTERRIIADRPWTHDDLHWATDQAGDQHLHGTVAGRPGRRGPVTRGGWCPCGRVHRREDEDGPAQSVA
jgi:hypothetical protein